MPGRTFVSERNSSAPGELSHEKTDSPNAVACPILPAAKMFTGTYTAIVTPFKNGKIDDVAFARLIKNQIKGRVDGIVPVGTTGESPTVDCREHIRIIELAVKF